MSRTRTTMWLAMLVSAVTLVAALSGAAPAVPPAAASAPDPGFTSRGIPLQGQVLLGGATTSSYRAFEEQVGGVTGMHRSYFGGRQLCAAETTAIRDISAGRVPWMSFKLPYSWADMAAGRGDAWAANLAERLGSVGGPVWVAFHHEPEGDGSAADWVAMQQRLSPIFRAKPNIAYTIILMGWGQWVSGHQPMDTWWPGKQYVDVLGFDPYNWYDTTNAGSGKKSYAWTELKQYYDKIKGWLATTGNSDVKWAIAETGYTDSAAAVARNSRAPNGEKVSRRGAGADWLARAYDDMKAAGGIALNYFNVPPTANGEPADWTWPITGHPKLSAYAATLRRSDQPPTAVPREGSASQVSAPVTATDSAGSARVHAQRQCKVMKLTITPAQRWTALLLKRSRDDMHWRQVQVTRSGPLGKLRLTDLRRGSYKVRGRLTMTGVQVRTTRFEWHKRPPAWRAPSLRY